MEVAEAYRRCAALAESHYENFPVGWLIAKDVRPYVHVVYAFARVADDFADEGYVAEKNQKPPTREDRLASLNQYEDQLTAAFLGKPLAPETEWVFLALADMAKKKILPKQLFYDLLSAFKQDVTKTRYETFAEVLDYCRHSANPVGRLVLHLHDYRGETEHKLSDAICTALQLANFWQDVAVDLLKDRIYIPREDWRTFGLTEETLVAREASAAFQKCLAFQVERTWELFNAGRELPKRLKKGLSWEIRLTWLGGTTILKKIKRQRYDTLSRRPKLTAWDIAYLLPYAWLTK